MLLIVPSLNVPEELSPLNPSLHSISAPYDHLPLRRVCEDTTEETQSECLIPISTFHILTGSSPDPKTTLVPSGKEVMECTSSEPSIDHKAASRQEYMGCERIKIELSGAGKVKKR